MAKNILIIEDDVFLGGILKHKLTASGYAVELVADGSEGLEAIRTKNPDVVLLDIVLPTMNGYEILEAKQKDPAIKDIPVIVVSNSGQPVEISRVLSLGVTDYLVKAQFDPEEVLEKVRVVLHEVDAEAFSLKGKKLLWVEDDPMLSEIIAKKLSLEGCVLKHFGTGEDALASVEVEKPDLILLDIILPSMNGYEILEKMKAIPAVADIPVVMLSNLNQKDEEERALNLGAVKFFTKAALSPNEIVEQIRSVLCK